MSGLPEYTHEVYGTGCATINLPSGPIQVSLITSPAEFATDREITQAEYEQIRDFLREMFDNSMYASCLEDRARLAARLRRP
jgi:hypothetical protein